MPDKGKARCELCGKTTHTKSEHEKRIQREQKEAWTPDKTGVRVKAAPTAPQPREGWRASLLRTGKKGEKYANCLSNIITILGNEPAWQGVLAYDAFTAQIVKLKAPPWYDDDKPLNDLIGPWTDTDASRTAAWIAREWPDIRPAPHNIEHAVSVVADRHVVHPVRDWLATRRWDGKGRVDDWLIRLAGAEDTPYTRAVGAMFLIGAVARVFEPGCKVDHTLILEGKTGRGKSTFLRTLCGPQWFLETEIDLGSKDFYQSLHGKWIIELAELDSLNRGELSKIKAVLTKCIDTYRESYGRHRKDFPRQCVFTGTTEESEYLKDEKGNRRFLPVQTDTIKVDAVGREREQLWAEATVRYQKGERWYVTDRKLQGIFETEQEWRRQHDMWEAPIADYLTRPECWEKGVTTTRVLDKLDVPTRDQGRLEAMRVGAILRKLGWERKRTRDWGGDREYRYVPSAEALAKLKRADADKRKRAEAEGKLSDLANRIEKTQKKGPTKLDSPQSPKEALPPFKVRRRPPSEDPSEES